MAKIVYIHIGQHKTGTSSIQNWLWGHRTALSAAGYLLPETGFAQAAHHGFFYAFQKMKGYDDPEALLAQLRDEIAASPADCVLLTSEEFERFTQPMVATLMRYLADFDVRPILYIRRQDSYLISDYGQQVKMGAALGPFREYLEKPSFPERFNLLGLLGNWVSAGLLTRGHISVYDTLGAHSVVDHFAATIGAGALTEGSARPASTRTNVSWSYQEVDLIRRISVRVRSEHNVKAPQLHAVYDRHFEDLRALCGDDRTPLWPTQQQSLLIQRQHLEANGHAARLAELNITDTNCLTFKTGMDRVLSEKPKTAPRAKVNAGIDLVMKALGT